MQKRNFLCWDEILTIPHSNNSYLQERLSSHAVYGGVSRTINYQTKRVGHKKSSRLFKNALLGKCMGLLDLSTTKSVLLLLFLMFLAEGWTSPIFQPVNLISGNSSSGFQDLSGISYSHCRGKYNVCSLRSTPNVTPAHLFDYQLTFSPVPHIPLPTEVRFLGLETASWILASELFTDWAICVWNV